VGVLGVKSACAGMISKKIFSKERAQTIPYLSSGGYYELLSIKSQAYSSKKTKIIIKYLLVYPDFAIGGGTPPLFLKCSITDKNKNIIKSFPKKELPGYLGDIIYNTTEIVWDHKDDRGKRVNFGEFNIDTEIIEIGLSYEKIHDRMSVNMQIGGSQE